VNLSRLPSNGPVLSVVIPVFNEKPVLPRLYERLHKALDSLDFQYEIVFVDDGSTDDSHRYLAGLAYTYPWVRLVKLSRNFGKEAATTAGLDHALGHAVIIMDADLQDPPELIPLMVEAWRSGMDIVLMRRRSRNGEGAPETLLCLHVLSTAMSIERCDHSRGCWRFQADESSRH